MNDHLLESKRPDSGIDRLRLNDVMSSEGVIPIAEETPRSPNKNSAAYKILTIERQAKINVTFNTICVILFLHIIPLGTILSTFGNIKWYLMVNNGELTEYQYWVNLFFIQKQCPNITGNATEIHTDVRVPTLCQHTDDPVVYSYPMFVFFNNDCQPDDPKKGIGDPQNLCLVMFSFYLSGLIATGTILLGLIFHFFHLWQLMRIAFSRNPNQIRGFNSLRVSYFPIFFYVGSFLYWLLSSASLINFNTTSSLFLRYGSSCYLYVAGVLIFIALIMWFRKVYKKGLKRNYVNTLLNAEQRYTAQLHSFSDYEDV